MIQGTGDLPTITFNGQSNSVLTIGSGTEIRLSDQSFGGSRKDIHPKLYFTFVKSKLTKIETGKLKKKILGLKFHAEEAFAASQKGLYEELTKHLAIAIREQIVSIAGIDQYVTKTDIEKFLKLVRGNVVELDPLEEFPRVLPNKVRKKLKTVQEKELFDEYWILHTNLTKEKVTTTKEKIREKDPILFGKFSYNPDKFYYIIDWVDEVCDLTLETFVETMNKVEKDYRPSPIKDLTDKEIKKITEEVKERELRLQKTSPANFRLLMNQEDKTYQKLSWWHRLQMWIFRQK